MSISTAVTVFARTAVREGRIPFELRVSTPVHPNAIEEMTKAEFDSKIQAGLDAVAEGRVRPVEDVFYEMGLKYKK